MLTKPSLLSLKVKYLSTYDEISKNYFLICSQWENQQDNIGEENQSDCPAYLPLHAAQ